MGQKISERLSSTHPIIAKDPDRKTEMPKFTEFGLEKLVVDEEESICTSISEESKETEIRSSDNGSTSTASTEDGSTIPYVGKIL